ncbi:hypothetical protein ABS71_08170 [bacterium SCN 62-11]|nr:MAG: hypothetical protein ABS71_08170 [bacterium SCN 62-11]
MNFLKKLLRPFLPKPKEREITLAQLSYTMAYRILPEYAFAERHDLRMWSVTKACGPFFYLMTLGMAFGKRPEEADTKLGLKFQWHTGQLQDGRTYFLMEYPLTPEHSETLTEKEFMQSALTGRCVLPPYFSAMLGQVNPSEGTFHEVRYFVLGKSPEPGCTTLREVTADGSNRNLGMGPAADRNSFLEAIQSRASS